MIKGAFNNRGLDEIETAIENSIDISKFDLKTLLATARAYKAKAEELKKVVEWYADVKNHSWTVDFCDHLILSNAMNDEGERARQALKGVETK